MEAVGKRGEVDSGEPNHLPEILIHLFNLIWSASTITDDEYASLVASFIASTDHSLSCNKKIKPSTKPETANILRDTYAKECKRITDFRFKAHSFNIAFNACPCNFKHPQFSTYASLLSAYDKGILPESGGLLDQASKTMDAIEFLQRFRQIYEEDQHREQSKKNK